MASNPVEVLEQLFRIHGFFDDVNKVLRNAAQQPVPEEPLPSEPEDTPEDPWEAVPDLDPYALLGLRPGAPDEVVDAAFKALAKKFHPDRGGSPETMSRLSAAYQQIKEKRK